MSPRITITITDASGNVSITELTGGSVSVSVNEVKAKPPKPTTAAEWCQLHGRRMYFDEDDNFWHFYHGDYAANYALGPKGAALLPPHVYNALQADMFATLDTAYNYLSQALVKTGEIDPQ